jgi:transcriptional regulator with XRE-family HTH domain
MMKKLQEILRQIRLENNLSQENLAADLGLSITGYAKIERGETDVNYSRLEKIAQYYKINVIQLLSIGYPLNIDKRVDYKDEEIAHLKEIIKLLEQKIELMSDVKNIGRHKK